MSSNIIQSFGSPDLFSTETDGTIYLGYIDPKHDGQLDSEELLTEAVFFIIEIKNAVSDTTTQLFKSVNGTRSYTSVWSDRKSLTYKFIIR